MTEQSVKKTTKAWCAALSVVGVLGAFAVASSRPAVAQSETGTAKECTYVPLATVQQQFGSNIALGQADEAHCSFAIPNPSGSGLPMELSLNVNKQSVGNIDRIKKGCTPKLTAATYNAKVAIATVVKGVGTVACYTAITTKDGSSSEYDFSLAKKTASGAIVATFAVRGRPADLKQLTTAKQAQAKMTILAKAVASQV